jgi:hypothetical protein
MALSILDGNQSATTLSTILTSGQHITAHTVVSLGTQAITDMRSAVSGSVVSISNLPATQPVSIASVTIGNTVTIAGTVTANPTGTQTIAGTVTANVLSQDIYDASNSSYLTRVALHRSLGSGEWQEVGGNGGLENPLPISGTVTIGSALPAGTNRIGVVTIGAGTVTIGAGTAQIGSVTASISNFPATQPVSLTTLPALVAGTAQIGSVTASISGTVPVSISSVTVGNSVTIGSLPAISGTVTANLAISSSAITSGSFTSLTSATIVPGNVARKMATVYNLGAGQLFINAGASATTLGGGFMVVLSSGDFYECDYTTTTLSAIFATAGTASWVSH